MTAAPVLERIEIKQSISDDARWEFIYECEPRCEQFPPNGKCVRFTNRPSTSSIYGNFRGHSSSGQRSALKLEVTNSDKPVQ